MVTARKRQVYRSVGDHRLRNGRNLLPRLAKAAIRRILLRELMRRGLSRRGRRHPRRGRASTERDGRSAVRDTPCGSPPIRNRWVAIQFRNSNLTAGAVRESVDVDMVVSGDSSPPLVRLRVMRRSLRKLHPFLKMPVVGMGCGDGYVYPSTLFHLILWAQRDEKRSDARHASAGIVDSISSSRNAADGRFSSRPEGAPPMYQGGVTALGNRAHYSLRAVPCLGTLEGL